jgi:hypothetical protein
LANAAWQFTQHCCFGTICFGRHVKKLKKKFKPDAMVAKKSKSIICRILTLLAQAHGRC